MNILSLLGVLFPIVFLLFTYSKKFKWIGFKKFRFILFILNVLGYFAQGIIEIRAENNVRLFALIFLAIFMIFASFAFWQNEEDLIQRK